jgi:hypothetical protein
MSRVEALTLRLSDFHPSKEWDLTNPAKYSVRIVFKQLRGGCKPS